MSVWGSILALAWWLLQNAFGLESSIHFFGWALARRCGWWYCRCAGRMQNYVWNSNTNNTQHPSVGGWSKRRDLPFSLLLALASLVLLFSLPSLTRARKGVSESEKKTALGELYLHPPLICCSSLFFHIPTSPHHHHIMMKAITFASSRRSNQTPSILFHRFHQQAMNMSSSSSAEESDFPVQASIISKLNDALEPSVLRVVNESHMHNV